MILRNKVTQIMIARYDDEVAYVARNIFLQRLQKEREGGKKENIYTKSCQRIES